jgi:hypothetical protein
MTENARKRRTNVVPVTTLEDVPLLDAQHPSIPGRLRPSV